MLSFYSCHFTKCLQYSISTPFRWKAGMDKSNCIYMTYSRCGKMYMTEVPLCLTPMFLRPRVEYQVLVVYRLGWRANAFVLLSSTSLPYFLHVLFSTSGSRFLSVHREKKVFAFGHLEMLAPQAPISSQFVSTELN